MKLEIIKKHHVLDAADDLFENGIPVDNLFNNYWVRTTENREFPFLELTRRAYEIAGGRNFDAQSNESYRNYIKNLGFEINYYPEALSFIKDYEVNHFYNLKGRNYTDKNSEDVRDGNILKPFVRKLNYWAENSIVEGFSVKTDNSWKWTKNFKRYLWIRITKPGDSGLVYIVVGCDYNMLFMELNYQRNDRGKAKERQPLNKAQMAALDDLLKSSDYTPVRIKPEDLKNYTWEKLIAQTEDFIRNHEDVYDEMEAIAQTPLISGNQRTDSIQSPSNYEMIETPPPTNISSRISNKKSFKGRKVDWSSRHKQSGILGTKGELLVIEWEKNKLKESPELHKNVRKMDDGEGYDIISFNKNGNKIYIEVKTTTGSASEPFYISDNELEFAKANKNNYIIYRLYEFDRKNMSSKFFKLSADDLLKAEKKSITYEVSYLTKG